MPARKLGRFAVQQSLQAQELHRPLQAALAFGSLELAHLEAEDDIFGDIQMGKQGVGLEHHGDIAAGRRQLRDILSADADGSGRHGFKAGNQPEDG